MTEEIKQSQNSPDDKDSVDYQKRFEDTQSAFTKSQQELKELQDKLAEQETLWAQVSPHINWDGLQGGTGVKIEDEDGYVSKKELVALKKELLERTNAAETYVHFRTNSKNADLLDDEDLVGFFLRKTDPRKPLKQRLDAAAKSARDYKAAMKEKIEAEQKAKEEAEKQAAKDKSAKEAAASGLDSQKEVEVKEEDKPETPQQYVDRFRKEQEKRMLTNF